jgi:hypothetical protein
MFKELEALERKKLTAQKKGPKVNPIAALFGVISPKKKRLTLLPHVKKHDKAKKSMSKKQKYLAMTESEVKKLQKMTSDQQKQFITRKKGYSLSSITLKGTINSVIKFK